MESAPDAALGSACLAPPGKRVKDTVVVKWEEPWARLPQLLGYTVLPLVAHRLLQG